MSIVYYAGTEGYLVDNNDTMDEPLLPDSVQTKTATTTITNATKRLSRNSLWLGFVTGLFIELSTVGAHTLTVAVLGETKTVEHRFLLGMVWSLLLCGLGLSILWSVIGIVLHRRRGGKNGDQYDALDGGMSANMVKITIESRFLVGTTASLAGSCVWMYYVTDHTFHWDLALLGLAMMLLNWHVPQFLEEDPAKTNKDDNVNEQEQV